MKGGYLRGNGQTEVGKEENRNSKENNGSIALTGQHCLQGACC